MWNRYLGNPGLEEAVCGDLLVRGAKVMVPESRYAMLERKLRRVRADSDQLRYFLALRCGDRMIRYITMTRPDILGTLAAARYYSAHAPASQLAVRLHELGLFPEEHRRNLVAHVRDQVVSGQNADFLQSRRARTMFSDAEIDLILKDAIEELLSDVEAEIELWEQSYNPPDDPEEHFEPLKSCLRVLEEELSDREEVQSLFQRAFRSIDLAVEGLLELYDDHQDTDYEEVVKIANEHDLRNIATQYLR